MYTIKELEKIRKERGIQIGSNSLFEIIKVLDSPCDLLIFGLGNDSSFWHEINNGGRTVFIEDDKRFFDKVTKEYPEIEAYLVNYKTHLEDWQKIINDPSKLTLDMPSALKNKKGYLKWDVILVDGPAGYNNLSSGRMKSIYMSSVLAKKDGHIFVHDTEREVERVFCDLYLGRNFVEIKEMSEAMTGPHLRHYQMDSIRAHLNQSTEWTIATPFIDKPLIVPLWLENFEKLDFPRKDFKLLWVDMSGNPQINRLLKKYIKEHGHEFKEVEFIENPPKMEKNVPDFIIDPANPFFKTKRRSVAETMNLLNEHRVGNMLLWEDDILAPPYAWNVLKSIFDRSPLFLGVTGTQYYRHPEREGHVLAWNWEAVETDGHMLFSIKNLPERERGIEAIGASASGFMLYRKEFLDGHVFGPNTDMSQDIMAGWHINGFHKSLFGENTKLIMVWGIKFSHLGIDENGKVKEYKSSMCQKMLF